MRDRAAPPRPTRALPRRRAAGLRREEVALSAGISVTWYTWLEQGRAVRVSKRTLQAIARALRLDPTERAHLLHLAEAAMATRVGTRLTHEASPAVRLLADRLDPHPAYVVNGLWDALHANAPAHTVFGDFGARPGFTDNVLRRLFLDAEWRELFDEWPVVARSAVAQFRATTAHMVGDARWRDFVARLSAESDAFAAWWQRHELSSSFPREKIVTHPRLGRLRFLYASLAPDAEPSDVRVIVYVPGDGDTAARAGGIVSPRKI